MPHIKTGSRKWRKKLWVHLTKHFGFFKFYDRSTQALFSPELLEPERKDDRSIQKQIKTDCWSGAHFKNSVPVGRDYTSSVQ